MAVFGGSDGLPPPSPTPLFSIESQIKWFEYNARQYFALILLEKRPAACLQLLTSGFKTMLGIVVYGLKLHFMCLSVRLSVF